MTAASDSPALHAIIDRVAGPRKTPGLQLVVVDQSGIVFEHVRGLADIAAARPMTPSTTLMAYSMSKTITAAAVLQLVDDGRVQLDDQLARYSTLAPYSDRVTIRQLLSHTAGIGNPIPLRWVHLASDDFAFDELSALDAVLRRHPRLRFTPGTHFAYSNIGYWLLGEVVSSATGQSFAEYVQRMVIAKLGLSPTELAYAVADPEEHAAGYLETYSLMNFFKRLLIDRELIGAYSGRWLRICDHYVNGPAFGGLVGTARGFAAFLRDQLADHSMLFSDATRARFYEAQEIATGRIPMTPGWHIGRRYFYKEGGGGGFHAMMRLYRADSLGMVVMTNATAFDVNGLLDTVARTILGR